MAQSYRGRPPEDALASVVGPWCTWLRCVECGTTTVHALIVDALADSWRRDRCDRELYDRTADRTWRRIRRRLDALAAEGVTIVRALSPEDMCLDMSLVEVIEYADARRFLIRVCTTADPVRLLRAVELAEDLLDSPDQLGSWADDAAGIWRGLAITDA